MIMIDRAVGWLLCKQSPLLNSWSMMYFQSNLNNPSMVLSPVSIALEKSPCLWTLCYPHGQKPLLMIFPTRHLLLLVAIHQFNIN